jgi:hypothetical protein
MQPVQAIRPPRPRGAVGPFGPALPAANVWRRSAGNLCGGESERPQRVRILRQTAIGLLAVTALTGCGAGYDPPARDWRSGGGWENFRAEAPSSGPMLAGGQPDKSGHPVAAVPDLVQSLSPAPRAS